MNLPLWLIFGALNGMMLYWMKPDRSIRGFFGAALLGSGGAVVGGGVAMILYQALHAMNLVMLVILLMAFASIFLLVSNMFMQRKQLS
jgi:uncharacterized membrane protein YeaQ/YmgE (transglycosylase-associated protein family)